MADQASVPGVLLIAKKDAEQQALEEPCVASRGTKAIGRIGNNYRPPDDITP